MPDVTDDEVLTLAEAAALLRVAPDAMEAAIPQEDVPARRVGGEWRFSKLAILHWLRREQPARSNPLAAFGLMKDVLGMDEFLAEIDAQRGPRHVDDEEADLMDADEAQVIKRREDSGG